MEKEKISKNTTNKKATNKKKSVKKTKEKRVEFKLTIISLIAMMIFASFLGGLIGAIMQNIFFQNSKKEEEKYKVENVEPAVIDYSQYIDTTPESIMENAEWMYEGLIWLFDNSTEIEFAGEKMSINNGKVYIEKEGEQKEVTSINGNVKNITMWGEQTLERVYALTEEGAVWESICNTEENQEGSKFNDNFYELDFGMKVINMTNGDSSTRATEPPYFLLESGDLINKDGAFYDELEAGYVSSFGDDENTRTYISDDCTMAYYDEQTREYIPLTDEDDYYIYVKDAFTQKPSERNKISSEQIGIQRLYVIDEDGILYYYDFKENNNDRKCLKKYESEVGKKVQKTDETTETDESGVEYTNIKLTFDNGDVIDFVDVVRVMS